MPGVLRDNGYQTQAIGKMHVFPERSHCGFDEVRLHDGFLHFGRRYGGRNLEANHDDLTWLRRQPGMDPHADFGLEDDPRELHDLIDEPSRADEIDDWRRRLVGYLTGREEGFVRAGALVTGRPARTERSDITALIEPAQNSAS